MVFAGRSVCGMLAVATSLLLSPVAFGNPVFNPVADFSTISNPNGVWTFGTEATIGGALTAFSTSSPNCTTAGYQTWWSTDTCITGPFVARNNTGGVFMLSGTGGELIQETTELNLVPGNTLFTVVRWTAPVAGIYRIDGFFRGIDIKPTSSEAHVLIDGVDTFSAPIMEFGVSHNFLSIQLLLAGSTVDFVVGSLGDSANDSNGLNVDITGPVPEPAGAGLMLIGCAVLFAVRKWKPVHPQSHSRAD